MARRTWVIVLGALLAAASASAFVVTDGDFSAWTFGSFGTATATMILEPTGGNPGPRLNVTTSTASGTAFGTGLKTDFQTGIPLEGLPFTLSLDVLSGPGSFGQGQAIQLLVEQGGTIYTMSLGVTNVQASFTTLNFPGVINAGSFARQSGAGPATPVFDGSVATRFGFAAGNSLSNMLTQYYDNFNLGVTEPTPTPTTTPPTATATSIPSATPTLTAATATPTPTSTSVPPTATQTLGPGGPPPTVPTLSFPMLALLALALAGTALLLIRRP